MPDSQHIQRQRTAEGETVSRTRRLLPKDPAGEFKAALIAGMSRKTKAIPCRYLYDARGSELFEQICELPEYYLTRTETRILEDNRHALAEYAGADGVLVELGSGSSRKTQILLDAFEAPYAYMPIDVSRTALADAARRISEIYPDLKVEPVCADYAASFPLLHSDGRRIAFFPGSTIGNLTPSEALRLLGAWRMRLGPAGMMIVGVDLKKDPALLEAAYDDPGGVSAAFIRNILVRANAEAGAGFDPGLFDYSARYAAKSGRVEMHLVSTVDQRVRIADRTFQFAAGERVHVENAYKYDIGEFADLARRVGFEPVSHFVDSTGLFSVHVLGSG